MRTCLSGSPGGVVLDAVVGGVVVGIVVDGAVVALGALSLSPHAAATTAIATAR